MEHSEAMSGYFFFSLVESMLVALVGFTRVRFRTSDSNLSTPNFTIASYSLAFISFSCSSMAFLWAVREAMAFKVASWVFLNS